MRDERGHRHQAGSPRRRRPAAFGCGLLGFLAVVAKLLGRNAAIKLADAYGGLVVHVPRRPRRHHALVRLLGLPAVHKIAAACGPGPRYVPFGPEGRRAAADAAIIELLKQGVGPSEITRRLRVGRRTVQRRRARLVELLRTEAPLREGGAA